MSAQRCGKVQPRVGRIHTSSVESDGVRSNTPSAFEGRTPRGGPLYCRALRAFRPTGAVGGGACAMGVSTWLEAFCLKGRKGP